MQDRIGAALYRLAAIERRAAAESESSKGAGRLLQDVKKLSDELQRAFDDVQGVIAQCALLQEESARATARAQVIFEASPVPSLLTDVSGAILDANDPAVRLLNISRRHLIGRSFHLYLSGEREVFLKRIHALAQDAGMAQWDAKLRPRERSVVQTSLTAAVDPQGHIVLMLQPSDTPALLIRSALAEPAPGDQPVADGH